MIELATILDPKSDLSLEQKYHLSSAPINTRSPLIKNGYLKYVNAVLNHKVIKYKSSSKTTGLAKTQLELLQAEDEVKKISLYLWLSYKFPEIFPDKVKAQIARVEINNFCENSLKSNKTLTPIRRESRNNSSRRFTHNKDNENNNYRKRRDSRRKNY